MNKMIIGGAVLAAGLLFCCPKVEASEPTRFMKTYYLTEEEAKLVKQVAVLEAGGEDVDGIANVMQVVLNRKFSEDFPNTITGCVFDEGQFTTASRLAGTEITETAEKAYERVTDGIYQFNDSLYFESLPGKVWSDIHTYRFSYGGHDFYR